LKSRISLTEKEEKMSRIALVTGGTRGIGEAISVCLKNTGYRVIALYVGRDDRARAFSEQNGIQALRCDVADSDQCAETVARISNDAGPVEILVNNAGITRDATMR
jgi:acetoacetyl-CoA reductase